MALTFAAREWLVKPGEAYAITDLAKCSVDVGLARGTRRLRYGSCQPRWLDKEIDLYPLRALIAIGSVVKNQLGECYAGLPVHGVPHFSPSNRGRQHIELEDLIPWPSKTFERYVLETLERYHPDSETEPVLAKARRPTTGNLVSLYRAKFRDIARSAK